MRLEITRETVERVFALGEKLSRPVTIEMIGDKVMLSAVGAEFGNSPEAATA